VALGPQTTPPFSPISFLCGWSVASGAGSRGQAASSASTCLLAGAGDSKCVPLVGLFLDSELLLSPFSGFSNGWSPPSVN
jgi:hypothetical protein